MGRRQLPGAMSFRADSGLSPGRQSGHPAPWTKPLARRQEEPTSAAQEP